MVEVRDERQPLTPNETRIPLSDQTSPKKSHEVEDRILNVTENWILKNVKMRVCRSPIPDPEKENICKCGNIIDARDNLNDARDEGLHSEAPRPADTLWQSNDECTREMPTNAFGELRFVDTSKQTAKYVRVGFPTDGTEEQKNAVVEQLRTLLINEWHLPAPNLIISVTGGAEKFVMSNPQQKRFKRGIVRTAIKTGAWIVTGGNYSGVMKHVGKAVRDYDVERKSAPVVCIGIAPWGKVAKRDALIYWQSNEATNSKNAAPETALPAKTYEIPLKQLRAARRWGKSFGPYLEPHHTHFLLVDNGTNGKFESEIELRALLEANIAANAKTSEGNNPMLCVVSVEGGPGTLKTVHDSLDAGTPVVLVAGSGRVTDVLAFAVRHTRPALPALTLGKIEFRMEKNDLTQLKGKIERLGSNDGMPEKNQIKIDIWTKQVANCIEHRALIVIFNSESGAGDEEDETANEQIEVAILCALFKSARAKATGVGNPRASLLRLAIIWDRFDIAKAQILSDVILDSDAAVGDSATNPENETSTSLAFKKVAWGDDKKLRKKDFLDLMPLALEKGRHEFIREFIERKDVVNSYLKVEQLRQLYQKLPTNSVFRYMLAQQNSHNNRDYKRQISQAGAARIRNPRFKSQLSSYFSTNFSTPIENDPFILDKVEQCLIGLIGGSERLPYLKAKFDNLLPCTKGVLEFAVPELNRENDKNCPFDDPNWDLFIWSILQNNKKLALVFWEQTREPIAAALFGTCVLRQLAGKFPAEYKTEQLEYDNTSNELEELATGLLEQAALSSEELTTLQLVRGVRLLGGRTPLELAHKAHALKFVSNTVTQLFLNAVWFGNIALKPKRYLLIALAMFFPPALFALKYEDFEVSEDDSQDATSAQTETKSNGFWFCVYSFYNAPIVIFFYILLFYVVFLLFFCQVLLLGFDPNELHWQEYLVIVWVFTFLIDELHEVLHMSGTTVVRIKQYLRKSIWNPVMLVAILFLFIPGMVLGNIGSIVTVRRPLNQSTHQVTTSPGSLVVATLVVDTTHEKNNNTNWEEESNWSSKISGVGAAGRTLLALSLLVFCMRLLHFYAISHHLGPKVLMVGRMFIQLLLMAAVILVFMVGWGVAQFAMLFPSSEMSGWLVRDVLMLPYWQMHLNLFEDKALQTPPFHMSDECSNDPDEYLNYLKPRCSDRRTNWLVFILLAFYCLLTNLLLFNLLIAIFTTTYQQIQDESGKLWCFQNYDLVLEYYRKPPFPPPFNLLHAIYIFIKWLYNRLSATKSNKFNIFKMTLDDKRDHDVQSWLMGQAGEFVLKRRKGTSDSLEAQVKLLLRRLEKQTLKLETLSKTKRSEGADTPS